MPNEASLLLSSHGFLIRHISSTDLTCVERMICGERIHDDVGLEITSSEAARISQAYCLLEGKVKSFYADDILGDHTRRRFRVLSQKVKKLKALRIHWVQASPKESKFSVNHFSNLVFLQLENCPLSSIIGSFYLFREILKKLDISGSDGLDLCRLLLPWRADKNAESLPIPPSVSLNTSFSEFFPDPKLCWLSLTTLRICNCALHQLDVSLHYLPAVTEIDFCHNNLSQIIHLQDCGKLNILDLSHNRIHILSNISRVLGNLSSLYISHNQVRSLDGIDKLYSLRTFDVSFNLIDNFSELQYLTKLPYLESLHLIGNPISRPSTKSGVRAPRIILKKIAIVIYRKLAFKSLLADGNILAAGRDLPRLDHHPISAAHKQSLRLVFIVLQIISFLSRRQTLIAFFIAIFIENVYQQLFCN